MFPEDQKQALATWRPTIPGQRVRTVWDERRQSWLMTQEMDGAEFTQTLEPSDSTNLDSVQLAELREVNILAPLVAKDQKSCNGSARVFPDDEGHWSAWIPCSRCGGYRWQLPLPLEDIEAGVYSEEIERELARMLAHRVLWRHGKSRGPENCPGCIDQEMQTGEVRNKELIWFSVTYQQWQARLLVDQEMSVDISLGLPAWATASELEDSIRGITNLPPYDQEKDL